MKNEEELVSESMAVGDDPIAIAQGLIETFELNTDEVTHLVIEVVLENDDGVVYQNDASVSRTFKVPFKK
jgi:hypothetical protein